MRENADSKEILANLSEESKKILSEIDEKKAVNKRVREKEWKRIKSMIQIS